MRRLVGLLLLLPALATCGGNSASGAGHFVVVANFYPVAYAVQRVAHDLPQVDVVNLTPSGVEPHDLELTSDDVDLLESADLVLYVGADFQPAITRALKRRDGPSVDVAAGLIIGKDPHFWLDPTLMATAVRRVRAGLAKADPDNAAAYARNARAYMEDLAKLDDEFTTTLSSCTRKDIVTAHAAFHYLAGHYGLTQFAISGVEPGAEPDPQHLAALSDLVERKGITTVFYEELVPRDFAETLARETGVRTDALSPLEGLSKHERADGDTYLTVMRRNLAALATALDCTPAN